MRELPADTAPAGYACPNCQDCIFPPEKLVSPVADALRQLLNDVNWARAGLGLPLLEDRSERRPTFQAIPSGPRPTPEGESGAISVNDGQLKNEESVISFDHTSPTSRTARALPTSPLLLPNDADEDKYRRRSPLRFLARWWRTTFGHGMLRTKRMSKGQKIVMRIGVGIFIFVSFMVILSYFSRRSDDEYIADPMLDPMSNPNIRVEKGT